MLDRTPVESGHQETVQHIPGRGGPFNRPQQLSMTRLRRDTARVIPISPQGRALLLRGHDPEAPEISYWFTIGGEIEAAESARRAAVLELREETGLIVEEDDLIGPVHRGTHAYSWGGKEYQSRSLFFALPLDERAIQPLGMPGEVIVEAHWWTPRDLKTAPLSSSQTPDVIKLALEAVRAGRRDC